MRAVFLASLVTMVFAAAVSANSPAPDYGALPRDETSLRALDNKQLRIVRRAGAQCWHSGQGGFGSRSVTARACVISLTEGAVANSDSSALQAYHQALPFNARYNENRPAYYWQRLVVEN